MRQMSTTAAHNTNLLELSAFATSYLPRHHRQRKHAHYGNRVFSRSRSRNATVGEMTADDSASAGELVYRLSAISVYRRMNNTTN